MKRKFTVEKMAFPVDGYNYNVMVWNSLDGVNFYHCGIGKYCKTEKEAAEYIEQYKNRMGE